MPWAFKENRPIFQQIYDTIVVRILNGTYPKGEKLPSVREMAEEAGVNPNTMQRAMSNLESAGLAVTNRTSGRIVTSDEELLKKIKKEYALEAAKEFMQEMQELGLSQKDAKALLDEAEAMGK
ncbi:MAG: GntR family transcriptional regulator [Clostridiales bacterium]|nr:GntR family transcriptional regulator [Clostridiales bacterium]MBR4010589.1 GntR family transcriptional regulator [Clostridiales bacterium]MCR5057783.1 GntR family transcriptional regulator [Clostridiales bacterium]